MTNLYLDIETVSAPEAEQMPFAKEFRAPSNYKDPAKIEAAIAEAKKAWLDEAPLDCFRGRVIAVGIASDNDPVEIFCAETEEKTLRQFDDFLGLYPFGTAVIIGHNVISFDLPMLAHAYLRYGIHVPPVFTNINPLRHEFIYDTMTDYAREFRNDSRERVSLDSLAKFLKVGEKTGNGANFASMLVANRTMALDYLRNDVELVRGIYKRLHPGHLPPF